MRPTCDTDVDVKNSIKVVVDRNVGHIVTLTATVEISVANGKADLADLLSKTIVEQVRNKVANYTDGTYVVRMQCVILEQANATDKPED